jgi:hypothetical protein
MYYSVKQIYCVKVTLTVRPYFLLSILLGLFMDLIGVRTTQKHVSGMKRGRNIHIQSDPSQSPNKRHRITSLKLTAYNWKMPLYVPLCMSACMKLYS